MARSHNSASDDEQLEMPAGDYITQINECIKDMELVQITVYKEMVGNMYIWMAKSLLSLVESENGQSDDARLRLEGVHSEMKQYLGTDCHPAFNQILNKLVGVAAKQKDYERCEEAMGQLIRIM